MSELIRVECLAHPELGAPHNLGARRTYQAGRWLDAATRWFGSVRGGAGAALPTQLQVTLRMTRVDPQGRPYGCVVVAEVRDTAGFLELLSMKGELRPRTEVAA